MIYQSRIDYIFTSTFLNAYIENVSIKRAPKIPDHKAVIINFSFANSRGRGYWKLNTSLLENEDFQYGIKMYY